MKKKIVVILLCMLVIATALPAVGTINEIGKEENRAKQNVQTPLFQRMDYKDLLNEYSHQPFSSHPPAYSHSNSLKQNADENSIVCGYIRDQETSLPIEFASIYLDWRDDQGNQLWNYSYTNSAGFYSMSVAAGEIRLNVYASGYFQESTGWLEIGDYDLVWMNFSLYPVPPEKSVVCGYVLDSDTSLPIELADVSLHWRDDQGHHLYNSSFTNSAGFYSMSVAAGQITIFAWYTGYAFEWTGWIDVEEYQTLWVNFSLEPDTTPPIISNISLPDYVGSNHPGDISVDVSDDHLLRVEMILADTANITNHLLIWYYYDLTGVSGTYAVQDYEGTYGAIDQGSQSVPTTVLILINWTKADSLFTLALFKKNQTASEQQILLEFEKSTGHLTNIAALTSYGYILGFEYITDMIEPGVSIISPLAIDADFNMIYDPDLVYTLYSIGDPNNPSLNLHPLLDGIYQGRIGAADRATNGNITYFNLTIFQTEPHLEITAIRGGLGVTAMINNTGDGDAVKEPVSITVTGGLFGLINKTTTKEVDLKAGEAFEVKTGIIFGLGNINIAVTTPYDEETRTGTQIIIFTLVK
jgi:hypothetical protein